MRSAHQVSSDNGKHEVKRSQIMPQQSDSAHNDAKGKESKPQDGGKSPKK